MSATNKLSIYNLIVEVTRRCNMRCEHCLRRDARDVDMDERHVRALLERTAHVGTVTFTGGEPSLALDVIRRFYELAEEYDVTPSAFYIVTNGAENQLDLAKLCLEMYSKSDDKELCGVALSVDDYHDASRQDDVVRGLAFYRDDKEVFYSSRTHRAEPRRGHADEWVIRTGRAEDEGLGREPYRPNTDFDVELDGDGDVQVDTLYLACDGRLYPEGDMNYDEMDENPGIPVEDAVPALLDRVGGED